jgi:hypothetical protein
MSTISETPLARKIRALMAKANDPSVTEQEAASYAAKVQELLVKNGLAMSDVRKDDETQRGDIGATKQKDLWKSPARKNLLRAVCRFYMCEAVSPARYTNQWTIIGRPHNVVVAVEMTEYLIKTTVRLSNAYGRANIGSNIIDFRRGCMDRLAERLYEMLRSQRQQTPEYKSDGNPGNLPALFLSEHQLVKRVMEQAIPGLVYKKQKPLKQGSDAVRGREAANGISLQTQVAGRSGGRLAIGKS